MGSQEQPPSASSAPAPAESAPDLSAVDGAWEFVRRWIAGLTDDQVHDSSRLPGWTRGHVLTHFARSADGVRGCAESAARGEPAVQYPHGLDGRERDIAAGSGRPAAELVADVASAHTRLMAVWRSLAPDAWSVVAEVPSGRRSIAELVPVRRRELLVHLVDLDLGVESSDLPRDYLDADAGWLAEFRPDW